jgi:hypothetical protein
VQTFNDTFEAVASEMLEFTREQEKQLAPTLAFIDPFGWKGVPLTLIAELLAFDGRGSCLPCHLACSGISHSGFAERIVMSGRRR